MKHAHWIGFAAATLLATAAAAQSTSITTGPGGTLSGSVSVPGMPSMGIQVGNGQVTTSPPARSGAGASTYARPGTSYAGPGRSVTVRSPDGSASSSVSVSGGNSVVAGAGSPGSHITTSPPPRRPTASAPRRRVCPRGASRAYRARTHCVVASVRGRTAAASASARTGGKS